MGYNFFVDSLGFNKAVSPDNPYQRATAPFRKDQIDSSQTVGDQSLTGWWTRGQLSFHMGAGIKYYEVLDGQGILNRFDSSSSIHVFTPGAAMLGVDWLAKWTGTSYVSGVVVLETGDAFMCDGAGGARLVQGGYSGTAITEFTPSVAGGIYTHVTKGPNAIYAFITANGVFGIDKFPITGVGQVGSPVRIYNHTTAAEGVWYAKDRLWVADNNGDLYAVTANPSAPPQTLGTAVANIPSYVQQGTWTVLTSPPGGSIYISRGSNLIYEITLNSDGTVPTVASPTIVAELPNQEHVSALRAFLGYLVITTTEGARVAVLQADGTLVYGPLFLAFNGSQGHDIAVVDTYAFVTGGEVIGGSQTGNISKVYGINLASTSDTGPLVFPWVEWQGDMDGSSTGSGARGVVEGVNGEVWSWQGDVLYWSSAGARSLNDKLPIIRSQGTLSTGRHRLGTLDPKHFHFLSVEVGGDGGTIDVDFLDEGGNATSVATGLAPQNDPYELDISTIVGKRQAAQFRFTLHATTVSTGPLLLGYQLKALPVPKRQRLIRVPVFMFDVEQDASGHRMGKAKDAWKRLKALESYEEAHSIVTYRDDDTGETGTAYIESIETQVESTSSARASDRGFGGIVTITLRRIGA